MSEPLKLFEVLVGAYAYVTVPIQVTAQKQNEAELQAIDKAKTLTLSWSIGSIDRLSCESVGCKELKVIGGGQ
jgi:hypothetical protein